MMHAAEGVRQKRGCWKDLMTGGGMGLLTHRARGLHMLILLCHLVNCGVYVTLSGYVICACLHPLLALLLPLGCRLVRARSRQTRAQQGAFWAAAKAVDW
jgi:hypothetical protein